MSDKYIKREDALNEIHRFRGYIDEDMEYRMKTAINKIPSADVQPVVRGRWIWQDAPCFGNPYGSYKCECGCLMPHKTNFCPNCGADIRGNTAMNVVQ